MSNIEAFAFGNMLFIFLVILVFVFIFIMRMYYWIKYKVKKKPKDTSCTNCIRGDWESMDKICYECVMEIKDSFERKVNNGKI